MALIHPPQKPPVPVPKFPTRPHPPNEHSLSSAHQNPSWTRRSFGQHHCWSRVGKEGRRCKEEGERDRRKKMLSLRAIIRNLKEGKRGQHPWKSKNLRDSPHLRVVQEWGLQEVSYLSWPVSHRGSGGDCPLIQRPRLRGNISGCTQRSPAHVSHALPDSGRAGPLSPVAHSAALTLPASLVTVTVLTKQSSKARVLTTRWNT